MQIVQHQPGLPPPPPQTQYTVVSGPQFVQANNFTAGQPQVQIQSMAPTQQVQQVQQVAQSVVYDQFGNPLQTIVPQQMGQAQGQMIINQAPGPSQNVYGAQQMVQYQAESQPGYGPQYGTAPGLYQQQQVMQQQPMLGGPPQIRYAHEPQVEYISVHDYQRQFVEGHRQMQMWRG
jgi:hypothetical protein